MLSAQGEMGLSEQSRNVTTPPANKRCGQGPPQRSRSGLRSFGGPGSKGRRAVLRVGAVPSRSITRAQCRKGETVALIGIFATLYVWAASANGAAMGVENRSVLGAMFGICALLAAGDLKSARAQNLDNPTWPTHEWLTSTPEEQGMDSSTLAKLVTDGESQSFDSLLIVRHGRIVAEAYYALYTADIPHQIHSSTKAIISTLIGMLYKDGALDRLDHPVLDFFADRGVANVDDRKKVITIQSLLDMTSGFDWDQGIEDGKEQTLIDMTFSPNWSQFILDRPMAHAPGEVFNYTDANPNLASAIIT
jgi:hypothetical protein